MLDSICMREVGQASESLVVFAYFTCFEWRLGALRLSDTLVINPSGDCVLLAGRSLVSYWTRKLKHVLG